VDAKDIFDALRVLLEVFLVRAELPRVLLLGLAGAAPGQLLGLALPLPIARLEGLLRNGLAILDEHALPSLAFAGQGRIALEDGETLLGHAAIAIELLLPPRLGVDVPALEGGVGLQVLAHLAQKCLLVGQRAPLGRDEHRAGPRE